MTAGTHAMVCQQCSEIRRNPFLISRDLTNLAFNVSLPRLMMSASATSSMPRNNLTGGLPLTHEMHEDGMSNPLMSSSYCPANNVFK